MWAGVGVMRARARAWACARVDRADVTKMLSSATADESPEMPIDTSALSPLGDAVGDADGEARTIPPSRDDAALPLSGAPNSEDALESICVRAYTRARARARARVRAAMSMSLRVSLRARLRVCVHGWASARVRVAVRVPRMRAAPCCRCRRSRGRAAPVCHRGTQRSWQQ